MQDDVGHHIKQRCEVFAQRSTGDRRCIHRAAGAKRSAELGHLIRDLQRAPRRRAFIQHRRREVRQTRLVERVCIAASSQDDARSNKWQVPTLVEDQRQPV
jgi:hypothetical protein